MKNMIGAKKRSREIKSIKNIPFLFLRLQVILLCILFLFPMISSAEIEFFKENNFFDRGENLVAVISGNFVDSINRENVFFYREHVRVPMTYEVKKINENFYLSAFLEEKISGNYSVVIKGIRHWKGFNIVNEDIVANFVILENWSNFYVIPGFKIVSEDFFVEIRNIRDKKILVQMDLPSSIYSLSNSVEVLSGEIKKINFRVDSNDSFADKIKFNSETTIFELPIFYLGKDYVYQPEENITDTSKNISFKFNPEKINISLSTNSETKRIIDIINVGESLENVSIFISESLEPHVSLNYNEIEFFEKESIKIIEIYVSSDSDEDILEGLITAKSENFSAFLEISIKFVEESISNGDDYKITCFSEGGQICRLNEICSIGVIEIGGEMCCFSPGICQKKEEKSSTGKIVGWIIIILIIGLLFFFFKKYKKVKPKVDLLEIAKGKKK